MSKINVNQLSHHFDSVETLSQLNFQIESGTITCILGASGCGKTTLLRLIGGFEDLQQGSIYLDDQLLTDVNTVVRPEKRNIGMMFQDFGLFPHLTIAENLTFGIKRKNKDRQDWVLNAAKRLEIGHLLTKKPYQLSGGEQQRVALLRALAPEPKLLLLDEPFSALDPYLRRQTRDEVINFIRHLGVTTLIVTHDPEEAMYMSDYMLILDKGKLCQAGSPQSVRNSPLSPVVAKFFGAVNACEVSVSQGKVNLPILTEPLPIDKPCKQVLAMCYPENIQICNGNQFILVERYMAEYGGEKLVFKHVNSDYRCLAHCKTLCPKQLGEQADLVITPDQLFIFDTVDSQIQTKRV